MNHLSDRIIDRAISGDIMHAILIVGIDSQECADFARKIASAYCLGRIDIEKLAVFPDYREIGSEKIKIEDIRSLVSDTGMGSFTRKRRTYLIMATLGMSQETQNALLKTLEETPDDTLILLTGPEAGFLPTVRSRCNIVRIGCGESTEVADHLILKGYPSTLARKAASWSGGSYGKAERFCIPEYQLFREKSYSILENALFGMIPFREADFLTEKDPVFPDMQIVVEDDDTDEEEENKIRKKKSQLINVPLMFDVFVDVLRDAMMLKEKAVSICSPDAVELSQKIANRFTKKRILDMMDSVMEARNNLRYNVRPKLMIDSVLVSLSRKESKDIKEK